MRLLIVNLLATSLILFSAGMASAYEMRMVPTTPTTQLAIDQVVTFDVFLDTQGASGITLLSVGLDFDNSILRYEPALSDAEDYYPLYSAKGVDGAGPAVWLNPVADPPALWNVAPFDQVNIDFAENSLSATRATATNLLLATLSFVAIADGTSTMDFGFGKPGNVFSLSGLDIQSQVATLGSTDVTVGVIPEPTTALLVGLGLVGLGVAGRREA